MAHTLTIIHGDNIAASRDGLSSTVAALKARGFTIKRIEAKSTSSHDLEIELRSQALFSEEALVIEGLLAKPKSKDKDKSIELILSAVTNRHITLWDAKKLTATSLKPFVKTKPVVQEHKLSTTLFKFLDSFSPQSIELSLKHLRTTIKTTPDIVVFTLLSRRVADLIVALSAPESLMTSPWQKSNLIRQSKSWSLESLQAIVRELARIDWSIKRGLSSLSYQEHLDLLLLGL